MIGFSVFGQDLGFQGTTLLDAIVGGLLVLVILVLIVAGRRSASRTGRVVEELQHSTLHVTAIVDGAMDAIVTMDEEGRITQLNPQAERLFGWDADEVHGRLVSEVLVPPAHRLDHERGLSHWRRTGEGPMLGRVRELTALRSDGTEVPVDLSVNLAVRDGDHATFVAFLRDVTARQKAERIQGLRFVVASVLGEARTLAEAQQGVLAAVGTRLGCPMTAMWTPTLGGLGSEHQWAARPEQVEALLRLTSSTTIAVGNGLPGRVWSTGRPLTLPEVPSSHEDFERVRAGAAAGLEHAVAVPVGAGDRVLAVLEIFTASAADIDEEVLRTLDDLGGQLGQYLARRRAETLQESPERLTALVESAGDAMVTVAEDGAIVALNERARRLFGYTSLEVMGEDLRVLVAESSRERVIDYVSDLLHLTANRPARWCDVVGRRKDGGTVDIGLHITPLVVGGRQVFLCAVDEPGTAGREFGGGTAELRVYPGGDAEQRPRLA